MSSLCADAFEANKSLITELDDNVAVLQIFPGISTATIRGFLTHLRGAVISSYGAGNIPQREDVLQVIKEACDRGVVIVNITQCVKGSVLAYCKFHVSGLYRLSNVNACPLPDPAMIKLSAAGVVSGADMTPEVRIHGGTA